MKVLGLSEEQYGNNKYICEISSKEIAQIFNKWSLDETEIKEINIGDEINLGEGYNFKNDIISTLKSILEVNEKFQNTHNSIIKLAEMSVNKLTPNKAE